MIEKLLTPFQKFEKIESFSGLLLFCATVLALIWANSPWSGSYFALRRFELGFTSEAFSLTKPMLLWVNDGLMAIFFFLIGLEIKREVRIGELNTPRMAAFPLMAALGGMIVPVSLYFVLNSDEATRQGWGISMATDIAFSLAILKALGKRVPVSLKIFLTAFAIVDDLGAVLVIALFYSENVEWHLAAYALLVLAPMIMLARWRIYSRFLLVAAGFAIWVLFLKSGVHPTLAGVLLALAVPLRRRIDPATYAGHLSSIAEKIKNMAQPNAAILSGKQIEEIDNLEDWTARVQSPLQHLEHKLHHWVAYLVMPVFALFNAGIAFSTEMDLQWPLAIQVGASLFLGKFVGISLFSWLGIRLGLAELPAETRFSQIFGIAALAGVGFTMSIFIANLAFAGTAYVDSAKVGILVASFMAGLAGYLLLRFQARSGGN